MIPGDIMKSSDSRIIMGGINGLAMISENNLFPESLPTKMFFSKLFVNNKEVSAMILLGYCLVLFLQQIISN